MIEPSQISATITQVEGLDHIDSIRAPMDFVNVLTEVRKIVTVVFGVIIAALVVISVVIVSNATKASVFARREEIQIMKYVGATNSFIRIPFFCGGYDYRLACWWRCTGDHLVRL